MDDPPRVTREPPSDPRMPIVGAQTSRTDRRRSSLLNRISGPILGGVAGSVVTLVVLFSAGVFEDPPPPEPVEAPPTIIREIVETPVITSTSNSQVAAIAAKAIPSIVHVNVGFEGANGLFVSSGSGSGVVFSDEGYILTNNHVVDSGDEVQVIFPDGKIFPARVEGTDPLTDIAVLKVDNLSVVPIELAELETVGIGDLAVAVGNPLGLRGGPSVTSGIISALDRSLEIDAGNRLFGLIQTDAPITRGSSGGALVNEAGELLGITTAIGTSGIAAEGLGFAVPIDQVQRVASDLIATGEVRHAFLGIRGFPAFEEVDGGASIPIGAEIERVEPRSAIELAGAQKGDVIVSFDGNSVEEMDGLVAMLRNYRAGDTVPLVVLRGGETVELQVTLDLRPDDL